MCLAPFLNSFYSTTGVGKSDEPAKNHVRPCSLIAGGSQWDIKESSIAKTRNNESWKEVRQSFLNGKLHDLCTTCINAEAAGSSSPRQLNNEYLFEHLEIDILDEIGKIIDSDLMVENVYALDYMPSNLCNYACVMCSAGASSQRYAFEVKNGSKLKIMVNPVDIDFFDLISGVKILGFTGGETIMQPEVHRLLDRVIEQDLAKDIIITILTNASDFPDTLVEKFSKFKKVLYTVSIDGVGPVIEYQRRGANWETVQANAIKISQNKIVHEIVNHVTSAMNILNAMDFVDWCHLHDIKHIAVSKVFQHHLGVHALPPELKNIALDRLTEGRKRYLHYENDPYDPGKKNWLRTIDQLISTLNNAEFDPKALQRFILHIQKENAVSARLLHEVVPEWAPWFVN
jgi:hypothetical protein